jgi:glucose-6-phosphate isomerase
MKPLEIVYKNSALVPPSELKALSQKLEPEIKRIQHALTTGYDSPYASINLITDEHMHSVINNVAQEKKQLNPRIMVVIGIGGSNLGALAIHEALHGTMYNQGDPELKVYWADTVDSDYMSTIASRMEAMLRQGSHVLLTIISKSGSTTETAANAQVLLALLKQYHPEDYFRFVVAITDKDSALWRIATQERWVSLEIPKNVGGRYSVFSAAGLFPLAMLGVDIKQLLEGARFIMPELLDVSVEQNPAALSALILTHFRRNGKTIHDTFLFSVAFESIGKWYRQLLGESIGKEFNRQGQRVYMGITPTVSIGSTDLHSVGQLYMGGPRDKVTTFITLGAGNTDLVVPSTPEYAALGESIQDKTYSQIMDAIVSGVQKAYTKASLPFVTIALPEKSSFYLGQLLQLKMLEIMYLGYLLEVNPFDQPQVESYKQETREILAGRSA